MARHLVTIWKSSEWCGVEFEGKTKGYYTEITALPANEENMTERRGGGEGKEDVLDAGRSLGKLAGRESFPSRRDEEIQEARRVRCLDCKSTSPD